MKTMSVVFATVALGACHAQAVVSYAVVDLGPGIAYSINNQRQIVGMDSSFAAFTYQNGVRTSLGFSVGGNSRAWSVNDSGVVAGSSGGDASNNGGHAFTWQNGTAATIPLEQGYAINDVGQVAGLSEIDAAVYANGVVTHLGIISQGHFSDARGINNAGVVVGRGDDHSGNTHALMWQDGIMTILSTTPSSAWAVNNLNQVVGKLELGNGLHQATLWQNGSAFPLNTPGVIDSQAESINDAGVVVGYAGRAAIWQNGPGQLLNTMIDPGLGWDLQDAMDINSAGDIVGWGYHNGGTIQHAFLLTAVPSPGASAIVAFAALAITRRRRSHRILAD